MSNYHPNACIKLYTFVSKTQLFGDLSEVKLSGDRLNSDANTMKGNKKRLGEKYLFLTKPRIKETKIL